MAQNSNLEIVHDSFYVKKDADCQQCKFAYLHLSENPYDIYLALFENREIENPIVYWWEEDDYSHNPENRHLINEFIAEAYLSLYIKVGIEKPANKPIWKHVSCINCGIPPKWWDVIKNIKR